MRKRKKSCSRRMPSDALAHWNGLPVPLGAAGRRYYYNIIGKYGAQVQALLKKISALEIKTICPLHGPMLTEDLGGVSAAL